ncbi:hypothetical protein ABC304_10260 [Microbacterium sp. 1P10UB]|uniref:hypothetical protein n=1 Tax=unclassified Microbacterium TaxID=2609290 RepID=UPI0039A1E4F3
MSAPRITVAAPLERFRIAAAELPLRAREATERDGIVVVPGVGRWTDAAATAAADGASALVIADPAIVSSDALRQLTAELRIPVVVERPRLRPDVMADARRARGDSAPRMLIAEASGPASDLDAVTRDACGWLRVLSGGGLRVIAGDRTLALLETATGLAATVGAIAAARTSVGMRVEVLGEVQTQVDIGLTARVVTTSSAGALVAPARYETTARLTLRRALEALATGAVPADLDELADDMKLLEDLRRDARR